MIHSSIINAFNKYIINVLHEKLNNLFENKLFCVYEKCIIYSIELSKNGEFYEKLSEEESIVYRVYDLISTEKFKENMKNSDLFGLNIIIEKTKDNVNFIYDPINSYNEDSNISQSILKEYFDVCHLFKNIKIINHSYSNSYIRIEPRISITINGSIYNRPDREYVVVLNKNNDYNIQVYKVNEKKKREAFIFGIWIDDNIMSEPFFI